MTKAIFSKKQQPVVVKMLDGRTYVTLCLNEHVHVGTNEDGKAETTYEYDFNDFSFAEDEMDIEDINAHPEEYLDYTEPTPQSDIEKLRTETDLAIAELTILIAGGMMA